MDEIDHWINYAVDCYNYNIVLDVAVYCLCVQLNEIDKERHMKEIYKNRMSEGAYHILVERHLKENDSEFRKYFRLTPNEFNDVLTMIRIDIEPQPCRFVKKPISAAHKLCISLR